MYQYIFDARDARCHTRHVYNAATAAESFREVINVTSSNTEMLFQGMYDWAIGGGGGIDSQNTWHQ